MILFYHKKIGNIYATIRGRIHPEEVIKNSFIHPSDMDKEDVGKLVIPYKPKVTSEVEPIYELRLTNKETGRVEQVKIGEKTIQTVTELVPDIPYADLIIEFENGTKNPHDYKVDFKSKRLIPK